MLAYQPSSESSQQLYWVLKVMAGIAKSTTTPSPHDYSILWGSPKDFTAPTGNNPASGPTRQQTSHMSSAATHSHHAPEPNGANKSHRRISKPDRKTVVKNYSAFGIYWNPSLTHHPCSSLSNAPPNSETWQKQWGQPAHMTSPQIRRAPTKQWTMGIC